MSRACRRGQSSPSMSAASCDADSRMTPSLIGGQRNAPSSRRFQDKSGRSRPRLESSTGPPASSERRGSSENTDRAEARPSPAPPGCQRHAGSRPASSPQESNARGNRNHVAAFTARSTFVSVATSVPGLTRTTAAPSAISIVPHGIAQEAAEDGAAPSESPARSHAARGGALTTDSSPLRIVPPAEQLLRRQTISPCDSRTLSPLS